MKNVKFLGKKTNSTVKFRGSNSAAQIPWQKPKYREIPQCAGKLWALLMSLSTSVGPRLLRSAIQEAVHKVRHAIFGQF